MFRVLVTPGSNYRHISWRRPGSSYWDDHKTACLLEAEPDDDGTTTPFQRVSDPPDCPFCIRDVEIPEELKGALMARAVEALW